MPTVAAAALQPLLSVRDLCISSSSIRAVRSANLEVWPGRTTAVVGESGSGKSMLALSLMGLLPRGFAVQTGSAVFCQNGTSADLASMGPKGWRGIRGSQIAMVFQEPMTSLNPVLCVGEQVMEAVRERGSAAARRRAAMEAMVAAGLRDPLGLMRSFPHELSGGMRQRVVIAIALACGPALLIADEPTTALDVTVQAEVLDTIRGLATDRGLGVLLITHDLGLVARYADEVVVMRAGRTLERGPVRAVLETPRHEYTKALFLARPSLRRRSDVLAMVKPEVSDRNESLLVEVSAGHFVLGTAEPVLGGPP